MLASGAVTPRTLAWATTSSADRFRSADRMARTTGETDGLAGFAGAVVRAAARTGFGAGTFFLSFLRTVWTVPRMAASGAFRPWPLARVMTSSAVRSMLAVRM